LRATDRADRPGQSSRRCCQRKKEPCRFPATSERKEFAVGGPSTAPARRAIGGKDIRGRLANRQAIGLTLLRLSAPFQPYRVEALSACGNRRLPCESVLAAEWPCVLWCLCSSAGACQPQSQTRA